MAGVITDEHLIAEGAGAAGVEAVLAGRVDPTSQPVVVVLSGANVDRRVLREIV